MVSSSLTLSLERFEHFAENLHRITVDRPDMRHEIEFRHQMILREIQQYRLIPQLRRGKTEPVSPRLNPTRTCSNAQVRGALVRQDFAERLRTRMSGFLPSVLLHCSFAYRNLLYESTLSSAAPLASIKNAGTSGMKKLLSHALPLC